MTFEEKLAIATHIIPHGDLLLDAEMYLILDVNWEKRYISYPHGGKEERINFADARKFAKVLKMLGCPF